MRFGVGIFLTLLFVMCGGCESAVEDAEVVVIYTALDKIYSEPLLQEFEVLTGIKVQVVYDVESNKTVGLRNRIIQEKQNTICDVFWNNEIIHTIKLKQLGLLQPYTSPNSLSIPSRYKDAEGYWCGFAARARVIIYNTDTVRLQDVPSSVQDFVDPKWKGKLGMALPLFGTSSTHAASLASLWDLDELRKHFKSVQSNEVLILDGNATCMRRVAAGELMAAWTDTDDAMLAKSNGKPVDILLPDQGDDELGLLLIPNTLSLLKGCPHPENAKRLIDFLLSPDVERKLAACGSAQIPLHEGVTSDSAALNPARCKLMKVDFEQAAALAEDVARMVATEFVR